MNLSLQRVSDAMIVAVRSNSPVVLDDLVKQFGAGKLSYDELWTEIEEAFPACQNSSISNVSVGSCI
jgi:hypothetical protein